MRLSLGSVAGLAAALLVAFAFWPQNRAVQGPDAVVAQDKAQSGAATPGKRSSPNVLRERRESTRHAPEGVIVPGPAPKRPISKRPAAPELLLSSDVGQYPQIEEALDSKVDFTIEPQPLKEALEFISTRFQLPILIDSNTLEDANIDTSTEVKLQIPGIKLRQVMALLLEQLPQPLGFYIRNGVLTVTTVEKINDQRVVVIYDCRDLINLRSFGPAFGGRGESQANARPEGPGEVAWDAPADSADSPSGGVRLDAPVPVGKSISSPQVSQFGGHPKKSRERKKAVSFAHEIPLIRVIRYAGDEDDWKIEDGEVPRITELGGLLVINQNPRVHEKIKQILADLRRMKKEGAFAQMDKDRAASVPSAGLNAPRPSTPQAFKTPISPTSPAKGF